MIKWGHEYVARAAVRRNWKSLPPQFEADAAAFCVRQIKPHFDKKSPRERINAAKATTFEELQAALQEG